MLIDAVIFDMDGLMLDTEAQHKAAWQKASAALGYDLSEILYSRMIGRTRADAENLLLGEFGMAFPLDVFRTSCRRCETTEFASGPVKKHGLDDLLEFLDSRQVPKAVATSSEGKVAVALLEAAGLLTRFDVIATGDEVTSGKPAPDLFRLAASRLRIDPTKCLVLEDASAGVIAARRAGMRVFIVPDQIHPHPTIERLASGTFTSLAAVAHHLESALLDREIAQTELESLSTDRLSAVRLTSEDLQAIRLMHQDTAVMRTLGGVRDEQETSRWLNANLEHWDIHGFGLWTFWSKADGRFVGRCGLRSVSLDGSHEIELAYALASEYWGMGLATEMSKAILPIGFERLALDTVIILVAAANGASRRVAEKLGFEFERNTMWKGLPTMQYRLGRDKWTQPIP